MSDDFLYNLPPDCMREVMHLLIGRGERLGSGIARTVYRLPHDRTKVIKIENGDGHFQNVTEWKMWDDSQHCAALAKWLAPCHYISCNGNFLIQTYAHDLGLNEIPKKLPAFLTDHKRENFGKIGKQVVCRDYGHVIVNASEKLRNWRGGRT